MSKQSVKTTINDNIKQNGHQEITGQIMNSVLNEMVDNLAEEASTTEKLTELETKSADLDNRPVTNFGIGYYIDFTTGEKKSNSGYVLADVSVKKGEIIYVRTQVTSLISVISLNAEGVYTPLIAGRDGSNPQDYYYRVDADCTITISAYRYNRTAYIVSNATSTILQDIIDTQMAQVNNIITSKTIDVNNRQVTNFGTGYYIEASTGEKKSNSGYVLADVSVKKGEIVYVRTKVASLISVISLNADGVYTPLVIGKDATNSQVYYYVAHENCTITISAYRYDYVAYIVSNATSMVLNDVSDKVDAMSEAVGDVTSAEYAIGTGYMSFDGNFVLLSAYNYCTPILMHKGDTIDLALVAPSVVATLAEVKSDRTWIRTIYRGYSATESRSYHFVADRDMYVMTSWIKSYPHTIKVTRYGNIGALRVDVDSLLNNTSMYGYYLGNILGKYTAIGDSLTAGAYFDNNNQFVGNTDITYETIISRDADAELDICAFGGATAKTLWEEGAELVDYNNSNLFTIWLGTNQGYTMDEYNAIEPQDGWQNYPNTSTGYYLRWIDRIRATNPNAIIVLINIFVGGASTSGATLATTQEVIRKVAEDRGLLVIETSDYDQYKQPKWHGYQGSNIHFNPLGYINLARLFCNEIGAWLLSHTDVIDRQWNRSIRPFTEVNRIITGRD